MFGRDYDTVRTIKQLVPVRISHANRGFGLQFHLIPQGTPVPHAKRCRVCKCLLLNQESGVCLCYEHDGKGLRRPSYK